MKILNTKTLRNSEKSLFDGIARIILCVFAFKLHSLRPVLTILVTVRKAEKIAQRL